MKDVVVISARWKKATRAGNRFSEVVVVKDFVMIKTRQKKATKAGNRFGQVVIVKGVAMINALQPSRIRRPRPEVRGPWRRGLGLAWASSSPLLGSPRSCFVASVFFPFVSGLHRRRAGFPSK